MPDKTTSDSSTHLTNAPAPNVREISESVWQQVNQNTARAIASRSMNVRDEVKPRPPPSTEIKVKP
jgi:hypothetical protein